MSVQTIYLHVLNNDNSVSERGKQTEKHDLFGFMECVDLDYQTYESNVITLKGNMPQRKHSKKI